MKKLFSLLAMSTTLMMFANSCNQSGSSNAPVVGTWKMNALHLKEYDDQVNQLSQQVKSLSDSLAAAHDSASQQKFQSQLSQYQNYLADMGSRKDSSLKNTRWIFKSDNKYEDQEGANKTYKGYWEYNEKTKMLTRFLPVDSLKIDAKNDTLTVTFDSLNHIIFVKAK